MGSAYFGARKKNSLTYTHRDTVPFGAVGAAVHLLVYIPLHIVTPLS